MNTITLRGTRKRAIVGRFNTQVVVMQGISDAQNRKMEEEKEREGKASFKTLNYNVPSEDVLLYGKLDFFSKSDKKLIRRFTTRLWEPGDACNFIYSNYDLNSGIVFKDKVTNTFKGYTCTDIIQWVRHCHNLIGKPKNIVIYRFPKGLFASLCPDFFKKLELD